MRIIIRVDSSREIGSGHLMRCLTLADLLRKNNISVKFIKRELPENLIRLAEDSGYQVYKLTFKGSASAVRSEEPLTWLGAGWQEDCWETCEILAKNAPIDLLIVDHYAIDYRWEEQVRPYVKKIMVIDDLANRKHDCDLLLDQNIYHDCEQRYQGLVPDSCKRLLGPYYALLREEFKQLMQKPQQRDGNIKRILVFFGGSDITNETGKALEAIKRVKDPTIVVDVVVGAANLKREQLEKLCKAIPNVNYYCQVNNMASLMYNADLAIGAGGTTTWERCSLGLPSLTIVVADNQLKVTQAVAEVGATKKLGVNSIVTIEKLAEALAWATANPLVMREMSRRAAELMIGNKAGDEQIVKSIMEGRHAEF